MNSYFSDLGRSISAKWKQANHSLSAFPEMVQKSLEERPPSEHVDLDELIRDFLLNDEQPFQSSSGFGQPELIVFDQPRFYIQVLFWLDGTTDIHQHEFSGAFHVLAGSSVHSHFEFENPRPVTAHFRLGDLRWKGSQLLETGATVPIVSGPACIHSLFHLDTPSITVVVRTRSDPGTTPQFTYLPPHVALDPVQDDPLTMRRKQLLDALEQSGDPSYLDLVLTMLADLDFERGFFILQNCMGHLREIGEWDSVWEGFQKKHGELAVGLGVTLEEINRRDRLSALRGIVDGMEHRYFLALLLTVPGRMEILEMVSQRFPGDAVETILGWAEELAEVTYEGCWIIDAEFPKIVEVEPEARPSIFLGALRRFMTGEESPGELDELEEGDLAALQEAFRRSSWRVLEP